MYGVFKSFSDLDWKCKRETKNEKFQLFSYNGRVHMYSRLSYFLKFIQLMQYGNYFIWTEISENNNRMIIKWCNDKNHSKTVEIILISEFCPYFGISS